jgi:hypothetical protein
MSGTSKFPSCNDTSWSARSAITGQTVPLRNRSAAQPTPPQAVPMACHE